jgi:hypothetical protein
VPSSRHHPSIWLEGLLIQDNRCPGGNCNPEPSRHEPTASPILLRNMETLRLGLGALPSSDAEAPLRLGF